MTSKINKDDVERSTQLVRCRECGQRMTNLVPHLETKHRISSDEYQRRHGDANLTVSNSEIPTTELKRELTRLYEELGRRPTTDDMKRDGKYSLRPYYERFGSWPGALHATGIETP